MNKNLPRKPDPVREKRLEQVRNALHIALTETINKMGVDALKRTSMFGRSHRRG